MKLFAYSIRDVVSETFAAPFFTPNEGLALRFINQMLADPKHPLAQYPADHFIFRVGEFQTDSGKLTINEPTQICSVISLIPDKSLSAPRSDVETIIAPKNEVTLPKTGQELKNLKNHVKV